MLEATRPTYAISPSAIAPQAVVVSGEITVVDAANGGPLTKAWLREPIVNGRGEPTYVVAQANETHFFYGTVRWTGIAGAAAVIQELAIDPTKKRAIIGGAPLPHLDLSQPHRKLSAFKHGKQRTVQDVAQNWLRIDIDDLPFKTLEELQGRLPTELRDTAYISHISASTGHPSVLPQGSGYKAHLLFLLDRPLTSAQQKHWAAKWAAAGFVVDLSIYEAGQLLFLADPVMRDGLEDPYAGRRVVVVRKPGWREAVTPPDIDISVPRDAIEDAEAVEVVLSAHPSHQQEAVNFFYQHLDRWCTADGCKHWLVDHLGKNGGDFAHWVMLPGGPLARAGLIEVNACIDRAIAASVANGGREAHAHNSAKNALLSTAITKNNIVVSKLKEAAARMEALAQAPGFPIAGANAVTPPAFGQHDEEEWQALLPLDIAATAVPLAKEDWVPEAYRQWLADIAHRKGCPYDFVLATFVVIIGSLIGPRLGIKPMNDDDDWLEVPNIWGLVVSRSGTLKSPAISDVLAPVRECAKDYMAKFNEETHKYEAEMEVHKTAVGGLKRSVSAQFANGAPIINPTAAPEGNAAVADAVERTNALNSSTNGRTDKTSATPAYRRCCR